MSDGSSAAKVKLNDLALGAVMGCIFTLVAFALINWWKTPTPPPPPAIEVEQHQIATGTVCLHAVTRNGEAVIWEPKDGPGEQVVTPTNKHDAVWVAKEAKQGVYHVLAITSIDGEPHTKTVEILVGPRPPPPGPDPEPEPEPDPLDDFQQKLKAALAADHGKDKAEDLAALLIQAGKEAKVFSGSLASFQAKFATAARSLVGENLSIVRGILGEYMNENLPRDASQQMDAATRQKVHDVFTYLGESLDKVR